VADHNPARGYEYVEEFGVSITLMSANAAWQAIYGMLRQTGMSAGNEFSWPQGSAKSAKIVVLKQ
jgi:hypothetical protein